MKRFKIYFSVLLIGYGIVSCSDQPKATPESSAKEITDSTNIKLVLSLFKNFNDHNWENYASLYADSALFLDPSFGKKEVVQSKMQTIKKYRELQQMIPDVTDEIKSVYCASPNIIVAEFISHGTLPDKTKLILPICTIFKIENGKISEDHTYFDN